LLRLTGTLDAANADAVETAATTRLANASPAAPLVIDLGQVRFVSATGIDVLASIHQAALRRGIRLAVRGADPSVITDLVGRVGLADGLTILPDRLAARA
jgi:anti-anti-sigma factor